MTSHKKLTKKEIKVRKSRLRENIENQVIDVHAKNKSKLEGEGESEREKKENKKESK